MKTEFFGTEATDYKFQLLVVVSLVTKTFWKYGIYFR